MESEDRSAVVKCTAIDLALIVMIFPSSIHVLGVESSVIPMYSFGRPHPPFIPAAVGS